MTATDAQIQDLANTIALQADALATGKIDASTLYAHVRLIAENARMLEVWTADLAPAPVAQGKTYRPGAISASFPPLDSDFVTTRKDPA